MSIILIIYDWMHLIFRKAYIQFWKQWWEDCGMRWIAPECLYLSELHGLICLLYWSEAATYYLNYERKILDLIETQAICHLWDWNTDLRCCRDWNFEWYRSLGEFGSLAKDDKDNENMSSETFGKLNTTQIIMKHFSSLTKCILVI